MNKLIASLKKILGNKTVVTILGIILCLVILFIGYNYRINSKTKLVDVPYAKVTIQPRTRITEDMIGIMRVPKAYLDASQKGTSSGYYSNTENIIGKYSNYNTIISKGSIFYKDLVIDEKELPDSAFTDVPEGYTVIIYPVDIYKTYANSMSPGSYINIYYKSLDDNKQVMFGKFISNIKILDVKDTSGRHVFENSDEDRTPAYLLFAVPEETHLLLRKALYLKEYSVELTLVPNTENLSDNSGVYVSSSQIEEFINSKTAFVSVNDLPQIGDQVNQNGDDNQFVLE